MDTKPSIRFSPTIELGHVLQALVMVGALGGWALVGYQTVEKQLAQHETQMGLFKQQLEASGKEVSELRDTLRTSNSETRLILTKISEQLADLRVLVAGGGNAPRR